MKAYRIPAMLVFLMLSSVFGGFFYTYQESSRLRGEVVTAESSLAAMNSNFEVLRSEVARMQSDFAPVEQFVREWKFQADRQAEIGRVRARIEELGAANQIVLLDKRFSQQELVIREFSLSSHRFSMVARGEYWRVVNWLGQVEKEYPLAKVEYAHMSSLGSGVELSLEMRFPNARGFMNLQRKEGI